MYVIINGVLLSSDAMFFYFARETLFVCDSRHFCVAADRDKPSDRKNDDNIRSEKKEKTVPPADSVSGFSAPVFSRFIVRREQYEFFFLVRKTFETCSPATFGIPV